jgi:uncharacterized oligopeptide transporter (OPT) family protein
MDENSNNNPGCLPIWGMISDIMTNVILWVILGLIGFGYLLWHGISERNAIAYMVAGATVFAIIFGLGMLATLIIEAIGERREAARERREAQRFRDNVKENLAYFQMQAKLQQAQAQVNVTQQKALLEENRSLRRSLPGPNGQVVDIDALTYDDDIFDDLEE